MYYLIMVNQIIKRYVDIFDTFIKDNFNKENDYYVYNILVFKKIFFNKKIDQFLIHLKDYYYVNKQYYLTRTPITYNQFNTIIRQILKINNIEYKKNVKYINSKYTTEYHIYIN